jgi:hypothetical protein
MAKLPLYVVMGLFLACAHLGGVALADEPQLSPRQTVRYILDNLITAARNPDLHIAIEYRPPFLRATWQEVERTWKKDSAIILTKDVKIDLRYADFVVWNLDWPDDNVIVIECQKDTACYTDLIYGRSGDHGVINYQILDRVRNNVSNALNYLASFHVKGQFKDFFDEPRIAEQASGKKPAPTSPEP